MNQRINGHRIAEEIKLSYERVYQIYQEYFKTGKTLILKQQGRHRKQLTETKLTE